MKVLGIDPGLVITGYGVLERTSAGIVLIEGGTIDSGGAEDPLPARLRRLHEALDSVLSEHRPDSMALEQLYSNYQHPRTAVLMGHARGVICLGAGLHDVPLFHYTAPEVKAALTGNGRASKDQMQRMVRRTFGLVETPRPPDVADAIAIALCHLYQQGTASMADRLRLIR